MIGLLEILKEKKSKKKSTRQVAWAGGLGKIGNEPKKEALMVQRSRRKYESKINVVHGKFRSVSLWEVQWLHNSLLKESVLREKAGISNLMLVPQSVQILVKLFARQLSNQADAQVAFFDSILTAMLTPGS